MKKLTCLTSNYGDKLLLCSPDGAPVITTDRTEWTEPFTTAWGGGNNDKGPVIIIYYYAQRL